MDRGASSAGSQHGSTRNVWPRSCRGQPGRPEGSLSPVQHQRCGPGGGRCEWTLQEGRPGQEWGGGWSGEQDSVQSAGRPLTGGHLRADRQVTGPSALVLLKEHRRFCAPLAGVSPGACAPARAVARGLPLTGLILLLMANSPGSCGWEAPTRWPSLCGAKPNTGAGGAEVGV